MQNTHGIFKIIGAQGTWKVIKKMQIHATWVQNAKNNWNKSKLSLFNGETIVDVKDWNNPVLRFGWHQCALQSTCIITKHYFYTQITLENIILCIKCLYIFKKTHWTDHIKTHYVQMLVIIKKVLTKIYFCTPLKLYCTNYLLSTGESYSLTAQHMQDSPIFYIQLN